MIEYVSQKIEYKYKDYFEQFNLLISPMVQTSEIQVPATSVNNLARNQGNKDWYLLSILFFFVISVAIFFGLWSQLVTLRLENSDLQKNFSNLEKRFETQCLELKSRYDIIDKSQLNLKENFDILEPRALTRDISEISSFTATSFWDASWNPSNACFLSSRAWHSKEKENQHIIAHFPGNCTISGITTRGRGSDKKQYVTSYKLEYLSIDNHWKNIGVFDGNSGLNSLKHNDFSPVTGQALKLSVLSYNEYPVMKIAIYGHCD